MNQNLLKAIGLLIAHKIKDRIRQNKIEPKTYKTNAKGQDGATLLETGRLMNSIRSQVRGDTIYIGTNVKYARIHHEGGIIRPKNKKYLRFFYNAINQWVTVKKVEIPARPYMKLFPQDKTDVKNQINLWMKQQLKKTT
jgi:phage gpG-like protein